MVLRKKVVSHLNRMMKKRGRKARATDLLAKEASDEAIMHDQMGRVSSKDMLNKLATRLKLKAEKLRRSRKRVKKVRDFVRKKP